MPRRLTRFAVSIVRRVEHGAWTSGSEEVSFPEIRLTGAVGLLFR
jgi:hypothetical protein